MLSAMSRDAAGGWVSTDRGVAAARAGAVDDQSQGVQLARLARLDHRQLNIIEPLTNPAEHSGSASDAFDVEIPSLPGYGFSGKPAATGWARAASHARGRC
jgi:hypothetical protein